MAMCPTIVGKDLFSSSTMLGKLSTAREAIAAPADMPPITQLSSFSFVLDLRKLITFCKKGLLDVFPPACHVPIV